ncbi:MAG: FecR domain-containing protein [Gammaproteobacteria bacterium]|nr:FecR domain-containing protein [Gammaproteobacteria bacterium]
MQFWGVLLFVLLQTNSLSAEENCQHWSAKVTAVQGVVKIKKVSSVQWSKARINDNLCAYDSIQTGTNSKATLQMQDETFVVLQALSSLRITLAQNKHTNLFSSLLNMFSGEAFFRSRQSREISIITPFVNAVHEGTEFLVKVSEDHAQVVVFDGVVLASNQQGRVRVEQGQSAQAFKEQAPVIGPRIELRDAVQWTLYYPPVIDYSDSEQHFADSALQPILGHVLKNDLAQAFEHLDALPVTEHSADFHILYASLLLTVGQVEEALKHLNQIDQNSPHLAEALSLQSVIALTQNDQTKALKLAQQARQINNKSSSPHIALSYVYQSQFEIDKALKSARDAAQAGPKNGLAWARVSELELATGNVDDSMQAADQAQRLNPLLAKTNTVLGFARLASLDLSEAEQSFRDAIKRDPADPLARLGLGLAKIRQGHIKSGTRDMETAANLDPGNALIRSYLGKAYYEQRRGTIASTEYKIAKHLDPKDPTPWFYDAIYKQTVNRPVEALHDMQKAIELNDNRAVFRSKLLLDEDLASRSAALGRIYNDLGFGQLGRLRGWRAITADHANYSAHRLLSDSYSGLASHEIARVSELLQSQLLQPLNLTPVQPKLAETNILLLDGQGSSSASFNEFNPMFARNRLALQVSGNLGSYDNSNNSVNQGGNEVTQSGVWNNFSYSLGQFHYQTGGFRDNNTFKTNIYSVFAQGAITPELNLQGELRFRNTDNGDLGLNYDPSNFSTINRRRIHRQSYRIGGSYEPFRNTKMLFSFIYGDRESDNKLRTSNFFTDDYGPSGEVQLIGNTDWMSYQVGGGAYHSDRKTVTDRFIQDRVTGDITTQTTKSRTTIDNHNVYGYANIKLPYEMTWTLGVSYDDLQEGNYKLNIINPKIGVQWYLTNYLRVRAAGFRSSKRTFLSQQTIEPTQVAGFNQFFDDIGGSKAWRYGVGIDSILSESLYWGVEFSRRDIKLPFSIDTPFFQMENMQDEVLRSYLYWTPHQRLAVNAEYQQSKFVLSDFFTHPLFSTGRPERIRTHSVPVTVRYFSPNGWFASFTSKYTSQSLKLDSSSQFPKDEGDFWVLDAGIGYRLPKRYGILSFKVANILDNKFLYQESLITNKTDSFTPFLIPDRSIVGNITINF